MKSPRLFLYLSVPVVAVCVVSVILFRPFAQPIFQSQDNDGAKYTQPDNSYGRVDQPSNSTTNNTHADGIAAEYTEDGSASGPKTLSTYTTVTSDGAEQTVTVTYEDGITTKTTVTKWPDGTIGTDITAKPDRPGMPTPWDLSIEEETELAEQWLAFQDKDSSVIGVTKGKDGKFLPMYEDTIYIRRSERETENENVVYAGKSVHGVYDGFDPATEPVPAGIRVIELDKEGNTLADYISNGDPWQYIVSRGLDPIVYFYGEETADFFAEYFNAPPSVATTQHSSAEFDERDTAFAPNGNTAVARRRADLSTSEEVASQRRSAPSAEVLEKIQERGFDGFDDIVQRVQDANPDMIWRKQYVPDGTTPTEPEDFTKEHDNPMEP